MLGTVELAAASLRDGSIEQFLDVVPVAGSALVAARVKVALTLEEGSGSVSEEVISVKAAGLMGGARKITLGRDALKARKPSGEVELELGYGDVKKVTCEKKIITLVAAKRTRYEYVADSESHAVAVAARIQAQLHEYAVDVAIPFLVQRAQDKQTEAEKLTEARQLMRTSSASAHDRGLTHQSSLKADSGSGQDSPNGDSDDERISPIAQLNCDLLMADVANDVGRAIAAFDYGSLRTQSSETALQKLRVFMDSIVQFTLQNMSQSLGTKNVPQLVEAGVERAVLSSRYASILALTSPRYIAQEKRLQDLRTLVRQRPQSAFGIAEDLVSPLEWCAARGCLSEMRSMKTPAEELACLNTTATAIYREMQAGQARKREGKAPKVIGADEFTPIFIYVVCLSGLTDLHARCENLWALAAPSMLSGMSGYYLTQLQAALGFLDEMYTEESGAAKKGRQLAKAPYAAVIESQVSRSAAAARADEAEEAVAGFLASCGAAGVSQRVFEAFRQAGYPPGQWLAELEAMQKDSQLDDLLSLCRRRDRQTTAQFGDAATAAMDNGDGPATGNPAEPEPEPELEPELETETETETDPGGEMERTSTLRIGAPEPEQPVGFAFRSVFETGSDDEPEPEPEPEPKPEPAVEEGVPPI